MKESLKEFLVKDRKILEGYNPALIKLAEGLDKEDYSKYGIKDLIFRPWIADIWVASNVDIRIVTLDYEKKDISVVSLDFLKNIVEKENSYSSSGDFLLVVKEITPVALLEAISKFLVSGEGEKKEK